jgi:hypothetical protein
MTDESRTTELAAELSAWLSAETGTAISPKTIVSALTKAQPVLRGVEREYDGSMRQRHKRRIQISANLQPVYVGLLKSLAQSEERTQSYIIERALEAYAASEHPEISFDAKDPVHDGR